jgi:hypothetical protein
MDVRLDERDEIAAREADAAYDIERMRRLDYWDDADDVDVAEDEEVA